MTERARWFVVNGLHVPPIAYKLRSLNDLPDRSGWDSNARSTRIVNSMITCELVPGYPFGFGTGTRTALYHVCDTSSTEAHFVL